MDLVKVTYNVFELFDVIKEFFSNDITRFADSFWKTAHPDPQTGCR